MRLVMRRGRIVEFVACLPEGLRLCSGTTKPLLRAIARKFLPSEVVSAPKRGFEIPLLRWMRQDLNGRLHEMVLDAGSYASAHFDRRKVEKLLEGRGWDAKRWANITWTLLCLEMWWDNYRSNILPAVSHRTV